MAAAAAVAQILEYLLEDAQLGRADASIPRAGAFDVEHEGLVVGPDMAQVFTMGAAIDGVLEPAHAQQPHALADLFPADLIGIETRHDLGRCAAKQIGPGGDLWLQSAPGVDGETDGNMVGIGDVVGHEKQRLPAGEVADLLLYRGGGVVLDIAHKVAKQPQ